jgi:hypothetical protein
MGGLQPLIVAVWSCDTARERRGLRGEWLVRKRKAEQRWARVEQSRAWRIVSVSASVFASEGREWMRERPMTMQLGTLRRGGLRRNAWTFRPCHITSLTRSTSPSRIST